MGMTDLVPMLGRKLNGVEVVARAGNLPGANASATWVCRFPCGHEAVLIGTALRQEDKSGRRRICRVCKPMRKRSELRDGAQLRGATLISRRDDGFWLCRCNTCRARFAAHRSPLLHGTAAPVCPFCLRPWRSRYGKRGATARAASPRRHRVYELNGESRSIKEWCALLGLKESRVRYRIWAGWTPAEAFER